MSKVQELILRAGEVIRLFDETGIERIPKYKLLYRNDRRITAERTEIAGQKTDGAENPRRQT